MPIHLHFQSPLPQKMLLVIARVRTPSSSSPSSPHQHRVSSSSPPKSIGRSVDRWHSFREPWANSISSITSIHSRNKPLLSSSPKPHTVAIRRHWSRRRRHQQHKQQRQQPHLRSVCHRSTRDWQMRRRPCCRSNGLMCRSRPPSTIGPSCQCRPSS